MAEGSHKPRLWHLNEDEILTKIVIRLKSKSWRTISELFTSETGITRTAKQCRDRWNSKLCISKDKTESIKFDTEKIIQNYFKYPNQWAKIARKMKKYTENQVKNFFYSTVRRNIRKFNKEKLINEKILNASMDLLQNEELRKILLAPKNIPKNYFCDQFLPTEILEMFNNKEKNLTNIIEVDCENSELEDGFLKFGKDHEKEIDSSLENIIQETGVADSFPFYEFEKDFQFY